ncbi:MAG TPA: GNAT family N-acetyltransferase [Longimicrobiales bacterium]|nr:GNAT family N-acetyltransferase [Longimicrobiales bacterium]
MDLPLEFDYLTRRSAFRELLTLAAAAYAGAPRITATDEEIWRAFPRGYVGGWVQGRLRGCIQLWPLDGRRTADFLIGARGEETLGADDLSAVCTSHHTIWYFAGLTVEPEWQGRGLGAHLFAEAMVRWHRDLPWSPPIRFATLGYSDEARGFIAGFGMEEVRPGDEAVDGFARYARVVDSEEELFGIVGSARAAADRKGRLVVA